MSAPQRRCRRREVKSNDHKNDSETSTKFASGAPGARVVPPKILSRQRRPSRPGWCFLHAHNVRLCISIEIRCHPRWLLETAFIIVRITRSRRSRGSLGNSIVSTQGKICVASVSHRPQTMSHTHGFPRRFPLQRDRAYHEMQKC